jgi:hypothetical protein
VPSKLQLFQRVVVGMISALNQSSQNVLFKKKKNKQNSAFFLFHPSFLSHSNVSQSLNDVSCVWRRSDIAQPHCCCLVVVCFGKRYCKTIRRENNASLVQEVDLHRLVRHSKQNSVTRSQILANKNKLKKKEHIIRNGVVFLFCFVLFCYRSSFNLLCGCFVIDLDRDALVLSRHVVDEVLQQIHFFRQLGRKAADGERVAALLVLFALEKQHARLCRIEHQNAPVVEECAIRPSVVLESQTISTTTQS